MDWKKYDADKLDEDFEKDLDRLVGNYLSRNGLSDDRDNSGSVVAQHLEEYTSGKRADLNEIVGIHIFRPSEFDGIVVNDKALSELAKELFRKSFEWRDGSDVVARAIRDKFPCALSREVRRARAKMVLDALVEVCGRWIAIEVEASGNKDKAITATRFAIRGKQADFGVLIVPWSPSAPNRAYEGDALERIDDEFNEQSNLSDGPIYRMALVRWLDVCRRIVEKN